MKNLLVLLILIVLMSCEKDDFSPTPGKQCWVCTVSKATEYKEWNDWYQRWDTKKDWKVDGIEKYCDKRPNGTSMTKYDCVLL